MSPDDCSEFAQLKIKNNDEYFFKNGESIVAMEGDEKKTSLEFNDALKLVF